jgi:uncharacterized protein
MTNPFKRLYNWLRRKPHVEPKSPYPAPKVRITTPPSLSKGQSLVAAVDKALASLGDTPNPGQLTNTKPVTIGPYNPAPGVVPVDKLPGVMAMDALPYDSYINQGGVFLHTFPGYPYLAELAQVAEYRKMASRFADEMTRAWIRLTTSRNGDKTDRLAKLQQAMERLNVRDVFNEALRQDHLFGRSQIFLDVDTPKGPSARDVPGELAKPLFKSNKKVKKGSLKGLRVVEAVWSYPGVYNSLKPLAPNFYEPSQWFVMGDDVHSSRLITLVCNPVPDILKAAYSFGGVSMSQLAEPYVNNWLRTRQSVSDAVHNFSTSGIMTDLQAALSGGFDDDEGGLDIIKRALLFNKMRDNKGLMLLDKESEEFFQFNMPLAGLADLQQQAQEQMSTPANMPLVIFFGITPSGLNANSDGEIRVWYDFIMSQLEKRVRRPLKYIMDFIQLSEFGDIDQDISFVFEPLYELSDKEAADAEYVRAQTDGLYIDKGVVTNLEVRDKLANDDESPYSGLEVPDDLGLEALLAGPEDEDPGADEDDKTDDDK